MALTQQQYNTLLGYQTQVKSVCQKANQIKALVDYVIAKSDPSEPFASEVTMTQVNTVYQGQYATLKSELQTLINALP